MNNEFGPEELSPLAKVEAENRDLKRRLEALETAGTTTTVCPQCWGKKRWTERRADDPSVVMHYTCGTCGGSGRVKA